MFACAAALTSVSKAASSLSRYTKYYGHVMLSGTWNGKEFMSAGSMVVENLLRETQVQTCQLDEETRARERRLDEEANWHRAWA